MRSTLLFPVFSTIAAALSVPLSERQLGQDATLPRSLGPRDIFNRQSSFKCTSGYFCNSGQTCCGIDCCNTGYTCSSIFTCELPFSSSVSRLTSIRLTEEVLSDAILTDMHSNANDLWNQLLRCRRILRDRSQLLLGYVK